MTLKPTQRYEIRMDGDAVAPIVTIVFWTKDTQIVLDAIQSHFRYPLVVEEVDDSCSRITVDAKKHDRNAVRLLYEFFPLLIEFRWRQAYLLSHDLNPNDKAAD